MFPKSPSLGALTHRAWTEERAGPRSGDWGARCQHAMLRVAGAPAKHSPGRSTASRSGISQEGNASRRAALARRRVCGCCRADSTPLSVSAQPPARGRRRRPEGQVRGRRGEWTGAEGTEEAEDDVGWFAAAGRSGPTWARAEAAHTCGRHTRPIAKCRPQKEHAPLRVRGHCAQTRSLSPDGRKDRGSRWQWAGSGRSWAWGRGRDSAVRPTGRPGRRSHRAWWPLARHAAPAEGPGATSRRAAPARRCGPCPGPRARPCVGPVSQGTTDVHRSYVFYPRLQSSDATC